uniref:Uncharacterized protein n=1 Tax=Panagrolaimus davidi TaxID=227884 RepID=A0A914PFQ8_9BILA
MTLANRNGKLDFKIKHFRRQNPERSAERLAKRAKMTAVTDSELDVLSIVLNQETDSKTLHCVYKRTFVVTRFY